MMLKYGMNFSYPLRLRFKYFSLSPTIHLTDASGQEIFFIHQKFFKLKEDVRIYSNSQKTEELYRIHADRIIDISAEYRFFDSKSGASLGSVKQKGLKSLIKATFTLLDENGLHTHQVVEANPWAKVADLFLSIIPFGAIFSGLLFHPHYLVQSELSQRPVMALKKKSSFIQSEFEIEVFEQNLSKEEEQRLLLSLLMIALLMRYNG
jgi:uncharacterized protein YxjI